MFSSTYWDMCLFLDLNIWKFSRHLDAECDGWVFHPREGHFLRWSAIYMARLMLRDIGSARQTCWSSSWRVDDTLGDVQTWWTGINLWQHAWLLRCAPRRSVKTENEYLKNGRDTKDSLQSRKLPNKETVAAAHACLEIPVDTDPCRNGLVIFVHRGGKSSSSHNKSVYLGLRPSSHH